MSPLSDEALDTGDLDCILNTIKALHDIRCHDLTSFLFLRRERQSSMYHRSYRNQ